MLGAIHSQLSRCEDRLEFAGVEIGKMTLLGVIVAKQFGFAFGGSRA
jgi:hypothetical protein